MSKPEHILEMRANARLPGLASKRCRATARIIFCDMVKETSNNNVGVANCL
jgi:hypothetical protein